MFDWEQYGVVVVTSTATTTTGDYIIQAATTIRGIVPLLLLATILLGQKMETPS